MRNSVISFVFALSVLTPSYASADPLTTPQVDAILSILLAFGVDETTIEQVKLALQPASVVPTENGFVPFTPSVEAQSVTPTEPSVPTRLVVSVSPNKSYVRGAGCEALKFTPVVYDQYGNKMLDEEVVISGPRISGLNVSGNTVSYAALSTNSVETVRFDSKNLHAEFDIKTEDGLEHAHLIKNGSSWYEASSGLPVDKENLLCF